MSSILIIDDEFDIAEALGMILDENGHRVRIARNGREALDQIAREPPELVVLDMMMPVLDGTGVLRALREDSALRSIPVVMMSAGPRARAIAEQFGCEGFLAKPFDMDAFLGTVKHLLGGNGGRP